MSEDAEKVDVHGRVFQKISLDDRIYFAPVAIDDREESRLTSQHELVCEMFGDRLFSPQIPIAEPRAVLECGYGGGDWAVQCAEEFEDCEVRTRTILVHVVWECSAPNGTFGCKRIY